MREPLYRRGIFLYNTMDVAAEPHAILNEQRKEGRMNQKRRFFARCAAFGLTALLWILAAAPVLAEGPREEFIERIIALAEEKFDETGGKAQRAANSGDIYVCKNFTVYLFRENRDAFRMEEYPEVPLVIPDNQTKEDCEPYVYGVEWKDIPASEGNPFYEAAAFRYDESLSEGENAENARAFMMQAQRGDYFQMAAKYYYGTGAHSLIIIGDYDAATDSVRWTDSNMKGEKRDGVRYGYVQYDAEKEIDWFVDAFCRKSYGATLYRLRDDIIYHVE